MSELSPERRHMIVFYTLLTATLLATLSSVALVASETYVRWYVNKQFAFLSGSGLEVLLISTTALLISLAYLYGVKK